MTTSLFPDFSDEDLFPTFAECPLKEALPGYTANTTQFLLGTISENMTLAQNPTFICKDRTGSPFALTLTLPPSMQKEGVRGGGLDFRGYRKGWTVVVRGAVRCGVKPASGSGGGEINGVGGMGAVGGLGEGGGMGGGGGAKQGFIGAGVGDVVVIPTSLEKLAALHNREWESAIKGEKWMVACQACETVKNKDDLSRCKGCGAVWYCDRGCQAKGWTEKDHKSECKIFKALKNPLLDFAKPPPPFLAED